MFFPCREESLAEVAENGDYVIHAQVLVRSIVYFKRSDRDFGI
ncbi:hypothetical protein BTN49_0473 [Candidatus Enterovibrio escicola]|uniref:Uncharacterized protein n=1 Tax=Candidatus Enterovibrio escicola TaxID=1927127 RepID=A0A2A5T5Q0_9GAMM|nr:hypothetical protein [Candidatus Enterovibrio escacola]PCS23505.1 hypothetical protein BTN49_0473 [Candidatus Enterovibrio escacola]